MEHSRDYSASASARWLNCAGSVVVVRQYQDRGSSAAQEGTAAHQLGQIGLEQDLTEKELLSYVGKSLSDAPEVVIDKDMVHYVQGYIDYCRSFEGDHFVEIKVSYENLVKGGFGTSDFIAIDSAKKRIICVDLKYGYIEVCAEGNTQAQLYASGVVNEYGFLYDFDDEWEIETHIYQPRINNFSQSVISYDDLMKFGEFVKERVAIIEQPDPPFNPSYKACYWCLHNADCKALYSHNQIIIGSEFDNLDLPCVTTVNTSLVLENKMLIEAWLNAIEEREFNRLMDGGEIVSHKIVAGRGSRDWLNEGDAFIALRKHYDTDELETRKFISVAQAEKLMGKAKFAEFADLVIKTEGKPTLAPESDKRPPFNDVTCDFEEIS